MKKTKIYGIVWGGIILAAFLHFINWLAQVILFVGTVLSVFADTTINGLTSIIHNIQTRNDAIIESNKQQPVRAK